MALREKWGSSSTSSRALRGVALLLAAGACRSVAPVASLSPVDAALTTQITPLATGGDSVRVSYKGVLHNASSDTLKVNASCGANSLRLEFVDGEQWRHPTEGTSTRPCILMYVEVRIAPGDSAVLSDEAIGVRAERYAGVRWIAPIPGRYRLVASARRCDRENEPDCLVTVASQPFRIER